MVKFVLLVVLFLFGVVSSGVLLLLLLFVLMCTVLSSLSVIGLLNVTSTVLFVLLLCAELDFLSNLTFCMLYLLLSFTLCTFSYAVNSVFGLVGVLVVSLPLNFLILAKLLLLSQVAGNMFLFTGFVLIVWIGAFVYVCLRAFGAATSTQALASLRGVTQLTQKKLIEFTTSKVTESFCR